MDMVVKIATILSPIAIIAVFYQAYLLRKQIIAEHEKSRREKAVDLLIQWSKQLKQESSIARKIVEKFTPEQSRKLYRQEKLIISKEQYKLIHKIVNYGDSADSSDANAQGDTCEMSEVEVSRLRWLVLSYLNLLESILVAWQYSIVDKGIIEHQFSYIVSPSDGHNALSNFRTACGGEDCYPAIEIFCTHLANKRKSELAKKGNVA